jgi:hypothetical protein
VDAHHPTPVRIATSACGQLNATETIGMPSSERGIASAVIVYAVVDDALSPGFPLGVELEVFVRREDAERFIDAGGVLRIRELAMGRG